MSHYSDYYDDEKFDDYDYADNFYSEDDDYLVGKSSTKLYTAKVPAKPAASKQQPAKNQPNNKDKGTKADNNKSVKIKEENKNENEVENKSTALVDNKSGSNSGTSSAHISRVASMSAAFMSELISMSQQRPEKLIADAFEEVVEMANSQKNEAKQSKTSSQSLKSETTTYAPPNTNQGQGNKQKGPKKGQIVLTTGSQNKSTKGSNVVNNSDLSTNDFYTDPLTIMVMGHVDSGKSSSFGRLSYLISKENMDLLSSKYSKKELKDLIETNEDVQTDSDLLREYDRLKSLATASKKESFSYAYLLDRGTAEREQGITITACDYYLSIPYNFTDKNDIRRKLRMRDCPGHRSFVTEVISAASNTDAAVLVVDSAPNAFERGIEGGQTLEHIYLLLVFRVKHIIVAINKMDTHNWSWARFYEIYLRINKVIKEDLRFDVALTFLPICAMSPEDEENTTNLVATERTKTIMKKLIKKTEKTIKNQEEAVIMKECYGLSLTEALLKLKPSLRFLSTIPKKVTDIEKKINEEMLIETVLSLDGFVEMGKNSKNKTVFTVSASVEAGLLSSGDSLTLLPKKVPFKIEKIEKINKDNKTAVSEYAYKGESITLTLLLATDLLNNASITKGRDFSFSQAAANSSDAVIESLIPGSIFVITGSFITSMAPDLTTFRTAATVASSNSTSLNSLSSVSMTMGTGATLNDVSVRVGNKIELIRQLNENPEQQKNFEVSFGSRRIFYTNVIKVRLAVLDPPAPLILRSKFDAFVGNSRVQAELAKIEKINMVKSQKIVNEETANLIMANRAIKLIGAKQTGTVVLTLDRIICSSTFENSSLLGRVILRDNGYTVAIGFIEKIKPKTLEEILADN